MNIDKSILAELKAEQQKPKRVKMSRNAVKKGFEAISDAENAFFSAVNALSTLNGLIADIQDVATTGDGKPYNPVVTDFAEQVMDMYQEARKMAKQAEDMRYDYNRFSKDFPA